MSLRCDVPYLLEPEWYLVREKRFPRDSAYNKQAMGEARLQFGQSLQALAKELTGFEPCLIELAPDRFQLSFQDN
jgi:hypothetical protein